MLMYGANNQYKATTLLNQLDTASTDLIIPHMLQNDWSYAAAKQALLYEFGSAQVLTGSRSLTVHDAHIALRSPIKPYKVLYSTLMLVFQDNCSIDGMCGDTFGPANALVKPRPLPTPPIFTEGSGRFAPKANISKVNCYRCNCKGHYANTCTSNTGVHLLPSQDITIQGKAQMESRRDSLTPT
ncbi:hypothetical protein DSO57_1016021 [Entomophthora muscae]|uniref:Uncharacterized protein n=1 Tax=Entomophthora muscae TaxID=34485 RepID=A0ACC2TFY4_9FUNG|nr:hypothetical protein DSO57_1016021 [Entomophthora muscae]